jgi:hypothetical protein
MADALNELHRSAEAVAALERGLISIPSDIVSKQQSASTQPTPTPHTPLLSLSISLSRPLLCGCTLLVLIARKVKI